MLEDWLRDTLKRVGMTQTLLAEKLSEELKRSVDKAAVNKMLKPGRGKGSRGIAGDELLAIEKITRSSAPKSIKVPLLGHVGAGAQVLALEDQGDEYVDANSDAKPNTVAVEVDGDSGFPAFEPGTLLYYSENLPPDALINRRCVVKLEDGRNYLPKPYLSAKLTSILRRALHFVF